MKGCTVFMSILLWLVAIFWIISEATKYFGAADCKPSDDSFNCHGTGGRVWFVYFQGRMAFGNILGFLYLGYIPLAILQARRTNWSISSFSDENPKDWIKSVIKCKPEIGYVVECYHEANEDYKVRDNGREYTRRDSYSGTSRRLQESFPYKTCEDHSQTPPDFSGRGLLVLLEVTIQLELASHELQSQMEARKSELIKKYEHEDNHIKVEPYSVIPGCPQCSGLSTVKYVGFVEGNSPLWFSGLLRFLCYFIAVGVVYDEFVEKMITNFEFTIKKKLY